MRFYIKANFALKFTSKPMSECMRAQSCLSSVVSDSVTLWTVVHEASLPMGFSREQYWSGLKFPPPDDLPDPGTEPTSPALQADSLPLSHQGSPIYGLCISLNKPFT